MTTRGQAADLATEQGAGQAAAQVLIWLLEDFVLQAPIPGQVAVAIGVLFGTVFSRLRLRRLFKRKGDDDEIDFDDL